MKNEHEDYYNKKNDERFKHLRMSMIGTVVICVMFGLWAFGYLISEYMSVKVPVKKIKCSGYTVIDHERVVWCDGDTVLYDWQSKVKIKKSL